MADKTQARKAALRWLGTHTIIGVPARDLTADEADRHAAAVAAAERAHGFRLYEPVAPPADRGAASAAQAGKKE